MDQGDIDRLHQLAERRGITPVNRAPPARHLFTTPAGQLLSYLDWEGDGPPILFLHGGGQTAHTWDMVCLALREDARCVALDLRGQGDSGWAEDDWIEASVGDAAALIDHLQWDRVHLVGLALGAAIASAYVAAGRGTRSLTLIDLAGGVEAATSIVCPVLVVRGGDSETFSDPMAEALADRFPDGRWVVIPDAGHNVQEDNPAMLATVLQALLAFVEDDG